MALPKLTEGNLLKTFNDGTDVTKEFLNELQQQLIGMVGPRYLNIPLSAFQGDKDGNWDDRHDQDPAYWLEDVHTASSRVKAPVYLPSGAEIKEIRAWVKGGAGETGGVISLVAQPSEGSSGRSLIQDIGGTNPWAYATTKKHEQLSLSHVLTSGYAYWVEFENATASIADNYVYGVELVYQFGN